MPPFSTLLAILVCLLLACLCIEDGSSQAATCDSSSHFFRFQSFSEQCGAASGSGNFPHLQYDAEHSPEEHLFDGLRLQTRILNHATDVSIELI